ncbi:hypothetical protein BHM03_00003264 [Ensete ventricosum]|uniref:K Homology domain-containing protein n=1 Tax=Ensete ventricosum TaxID=4639 RepID=A0A445MA13_ENSVE|nr:hypothetical protein BHM03_00003264 [Ensete ventricosum]
MAVPDTKESTVLSRLLVTSNQTGCLLGKGGSIIAEMRKLSGAHIRILGKEQIPKGVPENDEVVQISGEFGAVQEALLQITARLKLHVFRDKLPTMNRNIPPAFVEQLPPYGLYMGRRESSPPRLYPNMPPFQKDHVGRPFEERSVFAHPVHGSGIPLGIERPAPWPPQAPYRPVHTGPAADRYVDRLLSDGTTKIGRRRLISAVSGRLKKKREKKKRKRRKKKKYLAAVLACALPAGHLQDYCTSTNKMLVRWYGLGMRDIGGPMLLPDYPGGPQRRMGRFARSVFPLTSFGIHGNHS